MTCESWVWYPCLFGWMGPLSPGRCWGTISPVPLETPHPGVYFSWERLCRAALGSGHFWPSSSEVSHLEPSLLSKARQAKTVPSSVTWNKIPIPSKNAPNSRMIFGQGMPRPWPRGAMAARLTPDQKAVCSNHTGVRMPPLWGVRCPSPGHFLLPSHSVTLYPKSLLKDSGWAMEECSLLAGWVFKVSSKLSSFKVYLKLSLILSLQSWQEYWALQMWLHAWVSILLVPKPLWKGKNLLVGIRSLCMFLLRSNNLNFSPSLLASPVSKSPTTLMALTELASLCQWGFFVDSVETPGCEEPKLSHQLWS